MRLCHQVDPAGADRLLRDVSQRLAALVGHRARVVSEAEGSRPADIRVLEPMVCLIAGVTTASMRAAIGRLPGITRPFGLDAELVVIDPPDRGSPLARRIFNTATFFFWYLFGVAAVLATLAPFVANRERRLCGSTCDTRPASYLDALHWLAQRLLLTDPDTLHPAAPGHTLLGWLVSFLGLAAIPVAVVALRQHWAAIRRANQIFDEGVRRTMTRASVLILVTTTGERNAVLSVAKDQYGIEPVLDTRHDPYVVFRLHDIAGAEVTLAQFHSGPYGPEGIMLGADDLIRQCRPDYVVLTGTCFGLKEKEQALDDIVIVQEARDLDHKKSSVVGGVASEQPRGHRIPSSVKLLQAFSAFSYNWSASEVHVGPMVSSGTVVNDPAIRDRLKTAHPDAVAGDMECHVLASAAGKQKADWIAVRGISDWGKRKDDSHRRTSATNAASYVLQVINAGLLSRPDTLRSASTAEVPGSST